MTIKEVAVQALQDAHAYLGEIDPGIYKMPLDLLFGASIGQHTRHFVEFYQCLLDQSCTGQTIDYALRARDLRIENDPAFAEAQIDGICRRLPELDESATCALACDDHAGEMAGVTVGSNVARELLYNIEHTIHHLAIIKIGLNAVAPGIALPEHFGVAPSTIRHKQQSCAQ